MLLELFLQKFHRSHPPSFIRHSDDVPTSADVTKEEAMQFVLLIYQGSTPTPNKKEAWASLPDDEKKKIYAEYAALNQTAGLKPGLPLGLPEKAATVRVEAGKTVVAPGPFLGAYGSVAGSASSKRKRSSKRSSSRPGFPRLVSAAPSRCGPSRPTGDW
jgi:hypothetical protein